MAEDAIDSGESLKTLQRMVKASGEPEKLERFL
jgi:hypoxanthine-guanine phosphoribosyltransferase